MSLKKASIVSVLALAVGMSVVSSASAATVVKPVVVQVTSSTYFVNGVSANIHSISQNGKKLVSIRELSVRLGVKLKAGANNTLQAVLNGHTVELKTNSKAIKVDGAAQTLAVAVKAVNGTNYVELEAFVAALGGQIATDKSGVTWISATVLLENVDHIQFADSTKFIASLETETGRVDYLVDAQSGKFEKLLDASDASELVINPNGTRAAYTNAAGEVYVLVLSTKFSIKVSADTEIKPELVWSTDGSTLYYLQGDKGSIISKVDVKTGVITKILDDKVDYKSNLSVSADGNSFTYTVTKPGAVVADATKPVDSDDVTIDMKGTEPQIYFYDSSVKDSKPIQLTTAADDKVFSQAAADAGNVYYVSVSADETAKATLVAVSKDKTVKTLFADKDVYQAVISGGKLYLLTEGTASNQFIYEVDLATGTAKQLFTVSDTVSEIIVKAGFIAIIDNGQVFLESNGHWKQTTR
jgi:hypothetical protein